MRRKALWAIPIIIGAGLIVAGLAYPVYTDVDAAQALKLNACLDTPGPDGSLVIEGWHERLRALETLRHPLMQSGISLILATLTVFGLSRYFRSKETGRWQTPERKAHFFALGIGVVALSFLSQLHSLSLDYSRGDFPWCADSMSIPMAGLMSIYTILLVIFLMIGGILAAGFGRLPVDLAIWRSARLTLSLVMTAVFGLGALGIAILGLEGARQSAFIGTPAAVVAIYLLLATRAALISPRASGE